MHIIAFGLIGLVAFYFWVIGHWFAAVVATPGAVLLGSLIIALRDMQPLYSTPEKAMIIGVCVAIAWGPFAIRHFAAEQAARKRLRGLSLRKGVDANFGV